MYRIFFLFLTFCVLHFSFSVFAADWTYYRGDEQATGCAAAKLPDEFKTVWKYQFKTGWIQATAVIADGTVFTGSSDNGMSAFSLKDGKLLWNYPVETGVIAPAVYFNGLLFFGDSDGFLYAVDASTGKERWKFQAKGTFDNSPNIDQKTSRVLIGSQDGTLYALDAATGKPAWEYKADDQIRCFPAIVGRKCFVAGCDAKFHIVDIDKGTAAAKIELEAPTGSTPAVWNDYVFFGTEGNEFLAVDWKKEKIVWRYKAKQAFRSPAACKDGLVIVCGMDKAVRCFAAATGEQRWEFRTKGRMEESGALIAGNRVYVPCSDSFLYVLDLQNGEKVNAVELGGKLRACPATDGKRIVIGTDDGTLFCLERAEN
ncbi:MAG: PQQ-binding-like beta-propeller repeat protein [Planctomycetaceae bacterium]|jgi:outer membrane protein assembly factor BamB|nr:PQQ-binding-like beta-propeller repeat protein [Planctomycetaceae bacterium]